MPWSLVRIQSGLPSLEKLLNNHIGEIMSGANHWAKITAPVFSQKEEKIYVVCRSRSFAESWAARAGFNIAKCFNYASSIEVLKFHSLSIPIYILYSSIDTDHWIEEQEHLAQKLSIPWYTR
jgi:hypothetical protein